MSFNPSTTGCEGDLAPAIDGLQGCLELGLADGLGKVVVETRFEAAITVTLHGVGGQGRDMRVASRPGLALSNGPECLEAVHRWAFANP